MRKCEVLDYHCGDFDDYCFLRCDTVLSVEQSVRIFRAVTKNQSTRHRIPGGVILKLGKMCIA
jgi:hypothetical protein